MSDPGARQARCRCGAPGRAGLDPHRRGGDIPRPPPGRIALPEPALHVVFTHSGAEVLRQALQRAGRRDEILVLPDDFSLGPIAGDERAGWFGHEPGLADWGAFEGARSDFWSEALRPGRRRIAWWSWRPAQELCGSLASLSRFGDGPCGTVDLGEALLLRPGPDGGPPRPGVAESLALLSPGMVLRNGLLDRAAPLPAEKRAGLLDLWSRLEVENAPLRVPTGGGGLESAPPSFFDDSPFRCAPEDWWPAARTAAEVLGGFSDTRLHLTGDLLLVARLQALAASALIAMRGGDPRRGVAGTEIRRVAPSARAP